MMPHSARSQVAPRMVEWTGEIELNDRLLQAQHANTPLVPANKPLSTSTPLSVSSSMKATLGSSSLSSSLASPNVPPLDSELSTLSSATTSCGESRTQSSSIFGSIETSPDAAIPVLETGVYQCPFHFLDCRDSFRHRQDWELHDRRHFLNQAPPSSVCCPFPWCRGWKAERGAEAWAQRMEHVARHHREGDRLTAACRPDVDLLTCLLRVKAIDMMRFQELMQGRAGVTTASAACVQNDPARDRRRGMGGPATRNTRNQ